MEKSYQNISYFFIGILLCALVGFHQTYTVKFPTFEGLTTAHHFHGLMLMSWFAMLIVQPILIKAQKYELHRQVGKISFVLIPLVLFSIFWVTKVSFLKNANGLPPVPLIGSLSLQLPDIFAFGLFYVLAMVNRKNSASHMRYMIGTSLLMIGPGLGRAMIIYGGMPFPVAVTYAIYATELVALVFLVLDYTKGRSIKPFAVILGTLIVMNLCWAYQMSTPWQAFGGWFAQSFFN